ncbi:hypothetical protein HBP98_16780 [Listeria booriae]|uniref:Uncharacterized protein n=1 Tax=Listeria booriae TaxID=1552123 RepID=A0A7X1A9I0_9LIST|nr:hypothetical protein [Listeria booriae]MBC2373668.1 hypothetical protein [Listeria booriae]
MNENEVVKVLHENVGNWQTKDASVYYLTDSEMLQLKEIITKYDEATNTDEKSDVYFSIEDIL